jgi:tetratricopeptide (TPR) repeat protein
MSDTPATRPSTAGEHFLAAIRGERDDLKWLETHHPCLGLFVRALDGGPRARERLRQLSEDQWEEFFGVISDDDVYKELQQDRADVAGLIDAIRGDEEVLASFQKQKPSFAKLAQLIRQANEESVTASNNNGNGELEGSAAADVGCLIGELHLQRGEYPKAVEAFTRALESEPTADAFEGRARAYRALAALDEERARQLRGD